MSNGPGRYDVVIVGAGVMGSAAAWHCALDGKRVLLLEQFRLGHKRGSSHGESRIFRYVHDRIGEARQMPATHELWRQLERASGRKILRMTGGLYMSPESDTWITRSVPVLEALGWPHRVLRGEELRRTYPQFRLAEGWLALEQPDAGILSPVEAIPALLSEAVKRDAVVRQDCRVVEVSPLGEGASVRIASGETIAADCVVICAGPWTSRFLGSLVDFPVPLAVTRQQVAYFAVDDAGLYAPGHCPVYVTAGKPHFYGFPIHERPGTIKVSLANDSKLGTDPDDPRVVQPDLLAELCNVVAEHMVGVAAQPVAVEPCLYTETSTSTFVVDRHPQFPQLVLAGGFSGRGFKHAIAIGRLLADLTQLKADDYSSEFWDEDYRITRFAESARRSLSAGPQPFTSSASSQGR